MQKATSKLIVPSSESSTPKQLLAGWPIVRASLRWLAASTAILFAIAYVTLFGLGAAEREQSGLPSQPAHTAAEALAQATSYVTHHPSLYYWNKQDVPAADLVLTLLGRSVALLGLALGLAALVGVPLGIGVAHFRRVPAAPLMLLISVLGVSTPSFLLGMFFWAINVRAYHWLGLDSAPLPQVGFGWDAHLVLPVLVLATRPLAQILQITYVSTSSILNEDYIRLARAKGLAGRVVISRHALPNILIPILTTLSTSLRFSLASLPVVEFFFHWPGVGWTLLEAIEAGHTLLVTDLIVSLGMLFLLINLALDIAYQFIDPRLKGNGAAEQRQADGEAGQAGLQSAWADLKLWTASLRARLAELPARLRPRRKQPRQPPPPAPLPASHARRHTLRSILTNPALLIGTLLIVGLFGLAFFGESLAGLNPYKLHGVMMLDGHIDAPPFEPSNTFAWGTDLAGRDVQALVLAGAKQTLALALAGMAARVLLGTILGVLAGWWQASWLDKLVNAAVAVWAAFPVTLFAMILILAIGIQKGMWVFVAALCIVGWGETAQFVRGQVLAIKPQLYIEAARAIGAGPVRILTWHVLPHLLAPLLVLAVREIGGVLMLLAELGFLNIFLGGGFQIEVSPDYIFFFSDIPEWGALLANIHRWWRAYPWMAWYPGAAFFVTILAFNLWGEGLRRLLEETRINVSRLLNQYTILAIGLLVAGLGWAIHTSTPLELYKPQARLFDAQQALDDIEKLAQPSFAGRESGTQGAQLAADYIARRMRQAGLSPAGIGNTYFQPVTAARFHMENVPRLEILNGSLPEALLYRQDFVEYTDFAQSYGWGKGPLIGLAFGPLPASGGRDPYGLGQLGLDGNILIVREAHAQHVDFQAAAGVLVVSDNPGVFQRKQLIRRIDVSGNVPAAYVTPRVAEQLLATAGSSLAQWDGLANGLPAGQVALTNPGATVRLAIEGVAGSRACPNVIGFIPGSGANMSQGQGRGLDSQVIVVSAHYDGLGSGPDGTLYPGANDNASGVAAMLEIARVLAQGPYPPVRTVVFVAWCDAQRGTTLSVSKIMAAKRGFNSLRVEAAIQLSSLGGGDGAGLAVWPGSNPHLAELFQEAASRLGVPITPYPGPPLTRPALTAGLNWDGPHPNAHTAYDTPEAIDPGKLRQAGQVTTLLLSLISRELAY